MAIGSQEVERECSLRIRELDVAAEGHILELLGILRRKPVEKCAQCRRIRLAVRAMGEPLGVERPRRVVASFITIRRMPREPESRCPLRRADPNLHRLTGPTR